MIIWGRMEEAPRNENKRVLVWVNDPQPGYPNVERVTYLAPWDDEPARWSNHRGSWHEDELGGFTEINPPNMAQNPEVIGPYHWVVQGYFNRTYGWERVVTATTGKAAREALAEARRRNPGIEFRILHRKTAL